MNPRARDSRRNKRSWRPRPERWCCFAGVACGLLWAASACTERAATPPGAAAGGAAASAASTGPGGSGAQPAPGRSPHGQMLSHYADTSLMRDALVAGKLADYQAAALALARDEWSPPSLPRAAPLLARVRAVATEAQAAPSLLAAAEALSTLAEACAACHVTSDRRAFPTPPDQPRDSESERMLAHAVAADRLWAGLILPSDESWQSGLELLVQFPALDAPSPEVSAAAEQLGALARQGRAAALEQRGRIFRDIMLTCSGCHERLGVVPAGKTVVR